MRKQPETTARTRQNLVEAFWSLYCVKGIGKITVREIALKAGYNRGTFYEYFADVNDVLSQIEESLLPDPHELPPPGHALSDKTLPAVDAVITMYERNRKYYVVLLSERGDPAFQAKIKDHVKSLIRRSLNCTAGVDEFEIDFTLEYMVSAMIGVLTHWFRQEEPPPRLRLLRLIYELTGNGLPAKLRALLQPGSGAGSG